MRHKVTLNPRGLMRPVCWVRGHNWVDVHGLHFTDPSGRMCRRCLLDDFESWRRSWEQLNSWRTSPAQPPSTEGIEG